MRPSLSCLLSISFFFTLFFHGAKSTNNLVPKTCKQMVQGDPQLRYNFCIAALEGPASKNHVNDLQGLGLVAGNLIKANASGIFSHIETLLKQKGLEPFYKGCLLDCQELYSGAIDEVRSAIDAFNLKDYFSANIRGSGVMDDSVTCEDGFKEKKGVVSPLTKMNDDMFQLCVIFLSITNMFH
ncbi:hypothetical protein Scep_024529 [Stephania cephalantha]|uniref:Pectinesterase inhibitor domain-containing protein n=1 Tax=Stephania cephalantha TaxID=152367 RepID=A0AAP0HYL0_9MAGN